MNELAFADIVRLPVIRFYEDAFRKATGMTLKIVPPGEPVQRLSFGDCENEFCTLTTGTAAGCAACLETQIAAQRGAARQKGAFQINCFAGLTDVAVPVLLGARHVATLMSGQVLRREPTQRDFTMIVKYISSGQSPAWQTRLRKSYFDTPVVTADRFEAIIQMLNVLATFLADFAGRQTVATSADEPAAVTNAKNYVRSHLEEPITLGDVVGHVHVSRFYFCKLFKRATGMTLTEYVTRVRLEKAKTLLVDPGLRISEIVFAAGFGSIPQFNSVFKSHVGVPPTEYRTSLRSRSLAVPPCGTVAVNGKRP